MEKLLTKRRNAMLNPHRRVRLVAVAVCGLSLTSFTQVYVTP